MDEPQSTSVFIADDHPLLRIGLRLSLNARSDIKVVGEAENGFKSVEKIIESKPDVALIDVDMPGLSGIEVTRILRKSIPSLKIIVLSNYNDENYINAAMKAGADGYILKNIDVEELIKLIKGIQREEPMISPYLVNLAVESQTGKEKVHNGINADLTQREREVLRNITHGKTNKDIANELFISLETVKSHTKNIFRKTGAKNRVEAARLAMDGKIDGFL